MNFLYFIIIFLKSIIKLGKKKFPNKKKGENMLRLLTPMVFREATPEYSLPVIAFENWNDIKENKSINIDTNTFKFLLPVSIGDFAESNVPACFSNNEEELKKFYDQQVTENHRKAFIISDFQVEDLDDICYSGTIQIKSNIDSTGNINKNTTITITYMNPIKTYAEKHISPRDLPSEVTFEYDRCSDMDHSIPKIKNISPMPTKMNQQIIIQAYDAAKKLHDASLAYDGLEYNNYILYYVDKNGKINLYENIGEKSFINKESIPNDLIRQELNRVKDKKVKKYE